VARRVQAGKVSRRAPWLSLPARALLFIAAQAAFATGFALAGDSHPWLAASFWWPVYIILANLATLAILVALTRREGLALNDLWNFSRKEFGRDALALLGLILIGTPVGALGFVGAAVLLYGGKTPEFVSALPMWAAWLSLVVTPVSIALVELPLYMGYATPRLEAATKNKALSFMLPVFWLALQHSALPLLFDGRFILFRFIQMLPVALFVGLAYSRTRRLAPLIALHFLLDLMMGLTVFTMSM
jgi:membrane protease YdiL (CAAX protease family)